MSGGRTTTRRANPDVTDHSAAVLLVILILEIKHFFADYPLQTTWMVQNKGTWGHPAGIVHAGIHAVLTTLAFFVITPTLLIGLAIVVGEFLLHYHIDVTKEFFMRRSKFSAADGPFWVLLGLDQLAHHLTYVAIAAILWATAT